MCSADERTLSISRAGSDDGVRSPRATPRISSRRSARDFFAILVLQFGFPVVEAELDAFLPERAFHGGKEVTDQRVGIYLVIGHQFSVRRN